MFASDRDDIPDIQLFSGLAPALTDRLLTGATFESVPPGTVLFREGEVARHVHVLISGIVELSKIEGRRECAVMMATTGDVFMPVAALFDEPYLTSARVLATARLLMLDAAVMRREAMEQPQLAMRIVQLVGGQWRMAVRQILDLKSRSAPERLGAFLLRLADLSGGESAELPIPKRHLAARVGISAETLSRTLQMLAENGLHLRGRRIIVKNREKIEAFCGPEPYPSRGERGLGVHTL